jgi:anti-anti-sigma factor
MSAPHVEQRGVTVSERSPPMPATCLSLESVAAGDERLIVATGELCLSSAPQLVHAAAAALGDAPSRLTLDLRGVTLLSSDGIAGLVKVAVRCRAAGAQLRVLLGEQSERVLASCGLLGVDRVEWVPAAAPVETAV